MAISTEEVQDIERHYWTQHNQPEESYTTNPSHNQIFIGQSKVTEK